MIKIGDEFCNTKGDLCKVVDYININKITVEFYDTGNRKVFSGSALRRGLFKNPMKPSLAGVGFIGEGIYKGKEYGRITKPYELWRDMINRCYNHNTKRYKNYGGRGVVVCKEWHNFQNFAEWCQYQKYFNHKGYHLDKDMLGDGALYSPSTCRFIPKVLNYKLGYGLKDSKAKMLGVYWDEAKGKYFSSCTDHKGDKVFLGYSEDKLCLHNKYMEFKISSVSEYVQNLYDKDLIDEEVYQSLTDYEVLKSKLNKGYEANNTTKDHL